MIIVIHFNIFHVTCLSPNKQKLSSCDRKCRTGDNTCRPKIQNVCMWNKSMSPHKTQKQCFTCRSKILFVAQKHRMYVRQEHIAAQNTKIVFLCDKSCPPYDKFVAYKHRNSIRGQHQFIVRATTMSPKNIVCISATRTCRTGDNLSPKNAKTVFLRQAHTNTANS